jgi:hypothetical protein
VLVDYEVDPGENGVDHVDLWNWVAFFLDFIDSR